jgi:hypothetical protein
MLADALGMCFRGAMYDIATHLHPRLPLSLSGSCLLLANSSRLMTGSTLVRVALELRLCYGVSCFVRDAVLKPCASFLVIRGGMLGCWARRVVYHWICRWFVVCSLRGVAPWSGVVHAVLASLL